MVGINRTDPASWIGDLGRRLAWWRRSTDDDARARYVEAATDVHDVERRERSWERDDRLSSGPALVR